jgi:hypothetical protein
VNDGPDDGEQLSDLSRITRQRESLQRRVLDGGPDLVDGRLSRAH